MAAKTAISCSLFSVVTARCRRHTIGIARNRSRGDGQVQNLALPTPLLVGPCIAGPWSWQARGGQMTLCGGTLLPVWVKQQHLCYILKLNIIARGVTCAQASLQLNSRTGHRSAASTDTPCLNALRDSSPTHDRQPKNARLQLVLHLQCP